MKQNQSVIESFSSLLTSIIIPTLILMYGRDYFPLSPIQLLLFALTFPASFSVFELYKTKNISFISILGILNVLLTGGIACLSLSQKWIAVKESAIPFCIGLVVIFSTFRKKPMIHILLSSFLNMDLITQKLNDTNKHKEWLNLCVKSTYLFSASFFISAILNFCLAKYIVVSPTGTDAFNHELGVLTALSYPVIVVPSMVILMGALWYFYRSASSLFSAPLTEFFKSEFK